MYVRTASVVTAGAAMGRMIRPKVRIRPAPSSIAASSISEEMPRKNCRRKNTANGVMIIVGSAMPGSVSSRPRSRIRTKFGSSVKMLGIIRPTRNTPNTACRPGHRSRENAYAASAEKNTCPTVTMVATATELPRYRQNSMVAPDPPAASASSRLVMPRARRKPPRFRSTGSRDVGCWTSPGFVDRAVRSIQ